MKSIIKLLSSARQMSFFVLLAFTLLFAACGKQPDILKNVSLHSFEQDGDLYADLNVELDMGDVQLPTVTIPVYDPDDWGGTLYGTVSLVGGFNGTSEIRLAANLTNLLELQGGDPTLPDGSPLPIGGLGDATVVQIPIDHDRHRIYFAADEGVALLGTALTFKEFDEIGQKIGGANLMVPFSFEKVRGAAGFFTSEQSGKSGFAVFVDMGQVISPTELLEIKSNLGNGEMLKANFYGYEPEIDYTTLYFYNDRMSRRKKGRFDNFMYRLHRKRTRLHIR